MIPFVTKYSNWGLAFFLYQKEINKERQAETLLLEANKNEMEEEPLSSALQIDQVRLELGYGLLPLVSETDENYRLTDQIKSLRRQIASESGFIMPQVRIQDNLQLPRTPML